MSDNSKVLVTREKLDSLANGVAVKSGVPVTMTIDEMIEAVESIVRPEGSLKINEDGIYDIARYETVQVDAASELTTLSVKSTKQSQTVKPPNGYDGFSKVTVQPIIYKDLTITPTQNGVRMLYRPSNHMVDFFNDVWINPIPDDYVIPTGTTTITQNGVQDVYLQEYADVRVAGNLQIVTINNTPTTAPVNYTPGNFVTQVYVNISGKDQLYQYDLSSFDDYDVCILVGEWGYVTNGRPSTSNFSKAVIWNSSSTHPTEVKYDGNVSWFLTSNGIKCNKDDYLINAKIYKSNISGYSSVLLNPIKITSKTITPTTQSQYVSANTYVGNIIIASMSSNVSYPTSLSLTNNSYYLLTGTIGNTKICEKFQWDDSCDSAANAMTFTFNDYYQFGIYQDTEMKLVDTCVYGYSNINLRLYVYETNTYDLLGDVIIDPIPSQYIIPSGSTSITTNGTHDVSQYSSAVVNVSSEPTIEPLSVTTNGTYTAPSGVDGYSPVTVNVSGGGGGGYTLLASRTYTFTVEPSTTTQIDSFNIDPDKIYTSDKIIVSSCRRKNFSGQAGCYIGNDWFFPNVNPANHTTSELTTANKHGQHYYTNSSGVLSVAMSGANSTGGVLVNTISSTGNVVVNARQIPPWGTMIGEFTLDIYALDYPNSVSPFSV